MHAEIILRPNGHPVTLPRSHVRAPRPPALEPGPPRLSRDSDSSLPPWPLDGVIKACQDLQSPTNSALPSRPQRVGSVRTPTPGSSDGCTVLLRTIVEVA